jgi:hypothetical protein
MDGVAGVLDPAVWHMGVGSRFTRWDCWPFDRSGIWAGFGILVFREFGHFGFRDFWAEFGTTTAARPY